MGNATSPYIIHGLKTAGQGGVGGHQQVFNLQEIYDINQQGLGETIYQNDELQPQQPA